MRLRTLVVESEGFCPQAAVLLRRIGDLVLADLGRSDLLQAVGESNILWVRLRHRIDAEVLVAAPALRIIVTATTGLNHIDVDEARRRGIRVVSLRGEGDLLRDVRATAEHTLAVLLALLRRIPAAVTHVRGGGWNRDLFRGHEVFGKTVGVVGYGRLGRLVARSLAGLGARVLVADPHVEAEAIEPEMQLLSLDDVLRQGDIITVHVAYSPATHDLFGDRAFSLMKEGSWFVNTSRGELVNEAALLAALRSGRIAGAALDVIADEHSGELPNRPLIQYARDHDTLLVTPHIGGCTVESMAKTELFMAERLAEVVSQGVPCEVS